MMSFLFKGYVDMDLIRKQTNFNLSTFLNKEIKMFTLPIPYLTPIQDYKTLSQK